MIGCLSLVQLAPIEATVDSDLRVLLRPIGPQDIDRVERALQNLSEESFRNRFWANAPDQRIAEYLCESGNELTWVALDPEDSNFHGFGGASLWRDPDNEARAEISLTIGDPWQRRGLGCLLFSILWTEGWSTELRRVTGVARSNNLAILNWWSGLGGTVELRNGCAYLDFELVAPEEFIAMVEYDLHAHSVQYEVASWLRHWQEVLNSAR